MLQGGSGKICMIYHMFPGLDLYCTDPAQHLITAGEDLDDLSDLSVRRVLFLPYCTGFSVGAVSEVAKSVFVSWHAYLT